MRIATDLKVELFRDTSAPWKMSAISDIDAVSLAVPYCHVVVPDKQMAHFLTTSHAGERNQTQIVRKLTDLPDLMPDLIASAQAAGGDATGWDWAGPGDGFCLDMSDVLASQPNQPPAA